MEDHEEPDVVAGYVLAERALTYESDPLRRVLEHAGTLATFRLLTTGKMQTSTLDAYAEHILAADKPTPDSAVLLHMFDGAKVRAAPYAYAKDITGETVLPLIEGDPMRSQTPTPILSDGDWLRLQAICDE